MARSLAFAAVFAAFTVAMGLAPTTARGDNNDVVLARLADVVGSGDNARAVGDPVAFRSFASELGTVLAPRLSAPADTLGFGGFLLSADLAFTSISNDAAFWRARQSSPDPAGAGPHGGAMMSTIGVTARKGIGFPFPLEIQLGAVHLLDSRLWAGQAAVKIALHEGYHRLPLPSLAVRGGVSRVMGESQIDLTIASIDASVSKDFGVGGELALSPYAGWNWLLIVPRSDVIDKTPHIDSLAMPADNRMLFVFEDQDTIIRNRIFGGLKIRHYVFSLILEANIALAGSSTDDRPGTDMACSDAGSPAVICDATDQSGLQQTYTATLGLDF